MNNHARDLHAENEALKARVEELEFHIAESKAEARRFELPGCEGLLLTPAQREILRVLFDVMPRTARHEAIYQALYGLRNEQDQPNAKIVQVHLCKIRRRLTGTPWRIVRECGVGYVLRKVEVTS